MYIFDIFSMGYLLESEILIQRTLMTAAFWVEGPELTWVPDRNNPAARIPKAMFAAASSVMDVFESLDPVIMTRALRDPAIATTSHTQGDEDGTEAMLRAASAREAADAAAAEAGGSGLHRPPGIAGGGLHSGGPFAALFEPQNGR
jgi:hypothetical protein